MELKLNLCLFSDGGGAAADGGAPAANGTTQSGEAVEILYGKQPDQLQPEETQQETPPKPIDRAKAFDELIKGEYKDEYNARAQKMINSRFKAAKALEERSKAIQPVLDLLSQRYGIATDDAEFATKLHAAVDADDGWLADEADRQGLTVAQLKEQQKAQNELANLRSTLAEIQRQRGIESTLANWQREAEQVAMMYPGFDLNAECDENTENGQQFLSLLRAGVGVKTAYQVVHQDELLSGAIQHAVTTTQQRTVDNIRARGMRPAEAGAGSQTAATRIVRANPADWSDEELDRVTREVLGGKQVYL